MRHLFQRSKRIILIVCGVAALGGGPGVSIASAVPNNAGGSGNNCANAKGVFDLLVLEYQDAVKSGDTNAAASLKLSAITVKLDATDAGCDTSKWAVPTIVYQTPAYQTIKAPVGTQLRTS